MNKKALDREYLLNTLKDFNTEILSPNYVTQKQNTEDAGKVLGINDEGKITPVEKGGEGALTYTKAEWNALAEKPKDGTQVIITDDYVDTSDPVVEDISSEFTVTNVYEGSNPKVYAYKQGSMISITLRDIILANDVSGDDRVAVLRYPTKYQPMHYVVYGAGMDSEDYHSHTFGMVAWDNATDLIYWGRDTITSNTEVCMQFTYMCKG